MKLTVSHRIVTRFDPPRRRLLQSLRTYPTDCASQKVLSWDVRVAGAVAGAAFTDGAGDHTVTFSSPGEVSEVVLEITGEVQTFDTLGVLRDLKEKGSPVAYLTPTRLVRPDAAIHALASEAVATIAAEAGLDRAHALAQAVTGAITRDRDPAREPMTAAEALEAGKGGPSDYAHLMVAAAQSVGMPARFVYGYFKRSRAEFETVIEAEDQIGATLAGHWPAHAWAEIWVEGMGWVGFDAMEECCPDEAYIRLCSGRDGADAMPVRAVAQGMGSEAHAVALDVAGTDQ
ncbi:transglutaminase family protein [Mangrovicoccus algicola]|uniref:Transglutaminase family protein n=1 Tax=Mangrovicoccus algicola TaxID=2771008 RepID=A0A8J7CW17_9RHOB|nr:transglutaminase family protein [Mangrovicoccus algicola]MBE3639419.1 transglutaminase family protein [Mangrovicoccus algicola]